ncbi:MAG: PEGA domain-containing protein [Kofleriaceae bacterium]
MIRRLQLALIALAVAALALPAAAAPEPVIDAPEQALSQKIAVWRFDALGIEAELVARLEALFRSELERLSLSPLPARRDVERKVTGELTECTGEDRCLAAIGKALGVDVVVAGSVGALGDNFVLNIKVVEVATASQLRRITTEPLRGTPDDLIDSVRVAAYRLLAPEQLHGSITILSDLVGGEVQLDGKRVGKTPLPGPVGKVGLGPHKIRVSAKGYAPFEETVEVRFQKSARVEVRLVADLSAPAPAPAPPPPPPRWYARPWALAAIGVGAVVVGAIVGHQLGAVDRRCVNCGSAANLGLRW